MTIKSFPMKLPSASALLLCTVVVFGISAGPSRGEHSADPDEAMGLGESIILGVVEGVTEFLPVSSTGHLILTQRAMGIESNNEANAFAICIQLGAIVAVLGIYIQRVKQIGSGLFKRNDPGQRLALNLIISFVPAAIVGLLFSDFIEDFFWGLKPIVLAWFVGGILILVVSWFGKKKFPPKGMAIEVLMKRSALIIGLMQCLAMWPGVSRSLVTIVGGILVGLSLPAAVEFSFLLGVVTLGAATAYKAFLSGEAMLQAYGTINLVAGFAAATISALLAVKWMVAYLNRHGLALFGYYRVAIALVVMGLMISGIIQE